MIKIIRMLLRVSIAISLLGSMARREMSRLIGTIISGVSRPHFPLIILESSLVQSSLPVLRAFANDRGATTYVLLYSLLYPPSTLVENLSREGLSVVDRTTEVPGYSDTCPDLPEFILNKARQGVTHHLRLMDDINESHI